MNRAGVPATIDPQSRRRPWRLVYGDGGVRPDASAAIRPLDGAKNMAIDAAILEAVKAGGPPTLRLYRWSPACLSFGRNQPTRDRYDRAAAAAREIDFVRRPTGGQAVLHDDELTYAVIAPVSVVGRPRAAYMRINVALVDGLGRLGVRAALSEGGGPGGGTEVGGRVGAAAFAAEDAGFAAGQPSGRAAAPVAVDWDAACFRRPARGEVVVDGAKLVGSAQRMEARTILQHGSILVGGSQAPAEELLVSSAIPNTSPNTSPNTTTTSRSDIGWTTLERELGGRPSFEGIADAVRAGFEAVFGEAVGLTLEAGGLSELEGAAVEPLRNHYASDAWTWRR